jgi:hypothetical protein
MVVVTGVDEEGDRVPAVLATTEKASSDRGLRAERASVQAADPEGDLRDCVLVVWSEVSRQGRAVLGGGDRVHAEADPAEGRGGEIGCCFAALLWWRGLCGGGGGKINFSKNKSMRI